MKAETHSNFISCFCKTLERRIDRVEWMGKQETLQTVSLIVLKDMDVVGEEERISYLGEREDGEQMETG